MRAIFLALLLLVAAPASACIEAFTASGITIDASGFGGCFYDADAIDVPYLADDPIFGTPDVEWVGAISYLFGGSVVYVLFGEPPGGGIAYLPLGSHPAPGLPFKVLSGFYPFTVAVSRTVNPFLCDVITVEYGESNASEVCSW